MINWQSLQQEADLDDWILRSHQQPVLFFKHSTRCSVSAAALNRLERRWKPDWQLTPVFIDLLAFRPVSDLVAQRFSVRHESPQAILVYRGAVLNHWSHLGVDTEAILASVPKN